MNKQKKIDGRSMIPRDPKTGRLVKSLIEPLPDIKNVTAELSVKQVMYASARLQGIRPEQAASIAGYSDNTPPSRIENNPNLRAMLLGCLETKGVSADFLAGKLKSGLSAKKTIYSTFEGRISDTMDIEDNETQHKYFRDALEIRGDIKTSTVDSLNVGVIVVPQSQNNDEWNSVTLTGNNVNESKSSTENENA